MENHRRIVLSLMALLLCLDPALVEARPGAGPAYRQRQASRTMPQNRRGLLGWCKRALSPLRRLRTSPLKPRVIRDTRGVQETRRGPIPTGTAPIPVSSIPAGGLFDISVGQGAFNINVVARGPRTTGHMSDLLARRVRQAGGGPIERINITDVVNVPTLDAMRAGTAFLDAPQLGRLVQRTMDALNLRPTQVEVSGSPKLNVYIKVAPRTPSP